MYNFKNMFFWSKKNKKVLVAMSGGVDSSVAALILKKEGFQVAGAFIRGYNVDGCQDRDNQDARLVAELLGIPFYVFNFEDEYKKRVVDYLLEGYRKGITPNPDVVCNREIKFGLLYDTALELGFDFVASGHYACIKWKVSGSWLKVSSWFGKREPCIYVAKDKNKDQSYFLWDIPKEKLGRLLFPLGNLDKSKVRKIAKKANLPVAQKKDSQGICFLGKFDFGDFLRENIQVKVGNIIDVNGKKVGEHDGVWFYTIGQKHGFRNFAGKPFYVIGKDIQKNELIVDYQESENLYCKKFKLVDLNFLDFKFQKDFQEGKEIDILVRTRYRQPLVEAKLKNESLQDHSGLSQFESGLVELISPAKLFPASGQSAVFYNKKGQMLGGGVIL